MTRILKIYTMPFLLALFVIVSLNSCDSGGGSGDESKDQAKSKGQDYDQNLTELDTSLYNSFFGNDELSEDIEQAKKIFHSIPSPLETAMLLKSAGAEYDDVLLNSNDNVERYTSTKSMALNLGIYTTDLSFASLFNYTQTAMDYMKAAKSMAEGLDITDAIDNETLELLEENLNQRDVVMDIISETFLNSSSYLKENKREDVAAIVLVGGWIEGLYLATKLVGDEPIKGNSLVDRILEQKLAFDIVRKVLADNLENENGKQNPDIVSLVTQLQPLKEAFDKVKVTTTEAKSVQGANQVSTIMSKTTVEVEPKDFEQIKVVVDQIRTSFIQ
ncbi:MAG: hypothetical protein JW801_10345 [Bacteroidales bacterium]|nr:hypothetical protein [Bacteroidales bacterium]